MKILSFDSTAKTASAAVTEGGRPIAEFNIDNGLTQSELLLPMAEAMLSTLKLKFSDIDALAVNVGPGSFTGVRIGVALVKGIAFGRDIPCIPVSTLEALAENLSGLYGIIVPCMDARRTQVYTAIFTSDGSQISRLTEDSAMPISELYEMLKAYSDKDVYLVGDGYAIVEKSLREYGLENLKSTPPLLRAQNAVSVGSVATRMLENESYTTDKELSPIYLRLPQAERERLEREKGEK